jgi:hypothetical protein
MMPDIQHSEELEI